MFKKLLILFLLVSKIDAHAQGDPCVSDSSAEPTPRIIITAAELRELRKIITEAHSESANLRNQEQKYINRLQPYDIVGIRCAFGIFMENRATCCCFLSKKDKLFEQDFSQIISKLHLLQTQTNINQATFSITVVPLPTWARNSITQGPEGGV